MLPLSRRTWLSARVVAATGASRAKDAHSRGSSSGRPSGPDYWDRVAIDWQDGRDRLWRAHADAVNTALCRRWLSPAPVDRLLKTDAFDEAVGQGLWPLLVTRSRRVDVIDCSHGAARGARTRHGLHATVADVRGLPFASSSFDTVVSNSTLDHFADPADIARSLEELHRVLVSGGRMLLTLDNAAHPLIGLRNALPRVWTRLGLVPYFVGATMGPTPAVDLVTRLGFRVLDVTAVLHCPRVLAVPVARLLDRHTRSARWTDLLLRALQPFERAERWPTRFRTGHFVALLAEKL